MPHALRMRVVRGGSSKSRKPCRVVGFSVEMVFPFREADAEAFARAVKGGLLQVRLDRENNLLQCEMESSKFEGASMALTDEEAIRVVQQMFGEDGVLLTDHKLVLERISPSPTDPLVLYESRNGVPKSKSKRT